MDERPLVVLLAGAVLIAASSPRARDAAERAVHTDVARLVQRGRRRAEALTAVASTAIGTGIVIYAHVSRSRTAGSR